VTKAYDRDIETEENGIPPGAANPAFLRWEHDRGLLFDLRTINRRSLLGLAGGFGESTSTATAEGIPLTVTFAVDDLGCAPIAGAALYIWHCDRDGNYSLYPEAVTDQKYLRGIAETDANGQVTFTTIFPACYSGRWPHIHFEVYASIADATSSSGTVIKTSQLAFPEEVCEAVCATDGYRRSVANLSEVTLATDNVFSDDGAAPGGPPAATTTV